jgi:membrane protein
MDAMGELSAPLAGRLRDLRDGVSRLGKRETLEDLVAGFREHDLLIQASAIAFRVSLALIPCALFLVGLLGFLGLDEVWRDDLAPDVRDAVSPAAFTLIDDAVTQVIQGEWFFWITAGAAIAVWQMSGIVRAVGRILNRIYGAGEERPLQEQLLGSLVVAAAVGLLMLAAVAVVRLGPLAQDELLGESIAADVVGFAIRWAIAIALLLAAVALTVRAAPDVERPAQWVSFGAVVVVVSWAVMSLLFGLYLTQIADYGSVFGNLATVFVLLEYLYLSAVVFLGGLLLDSMAQRRS